MVEDALHRNGFVCIGVDLLVPEFGFGRLRIGPASGFKAFQARHCNAEVRLHRRNADAHRGDLRQRDELEDAIGDVVFLTLVWRVPSVCHPSRAFPQELGDADLGLLVIAKHAQLGHGVGERPHKPEP